MAPVRIAIVASDAETRMAAARAFDGAPRHWSVRIFDEPPDDADVLVVPRGSRQLEGCVTFDPERPADVVRVVEASLAQTRGPIVVEGACGGAGATTLALHLAAASGACVLDRSPHGATARRLAIEEWRTFGNGDDPAEASLPVAPGIRLLLAPERDDAVDAATKVFERVVVDGAPAALVPQAAARVVVFPPSSPAARRVRELIVEPDVPTALVVNRTGPGGSLSRGAVEREIGRRVTLMLPCTPALRDAEDDGRLLTSPCSRWLRGIARLARALESA
jgi:hypothetical protein